MRKTNVNYPHPVLSAANEDYIDSAFNIDLKNNPSIQGEVAVIDVSYELSCEGLKQLIIAGDAKVILYLESVEAEYRRTFAFNSDSNDIAITENKNMLSKSVQIRGYITAAKDINPFTLPEHNKDLFGGIPFNVKRGDILAISEDFYNVPLENYDPLADRPSIFSIRRQTERPKDEITVDFMSHDKITIFLNNDVYEKYSNLYEAPETRMFLASLFAAPVLVDVLSYIKHADQDMIDSIAHLKWYQVLSARLLELKIDLSTEDSMTKIANVIIPHIFKTNIEQFREVFKNLLPSTGGDEV